MNGLQDRRHQVPPASDIPLKIKAGLRPRFWPILFLLMPLQLQAFGLNDSLTKDAERRLNIYADQQLWPDYQVQSTPWLPASSARLPVCQEGLKLRPENPLQPPYGRISYQITCNKPSWDMSADVEVIVRMPVWRLTQTKYKNELIDSADVIVEDMVIRRHHTEFVPSTHRVAGLRVLKTLNSGEPLAATYLAPPLDAEKTDNVITRASTTLVETPSTGVVPRR